MNVSRICGLLALATLTLFALTGCRTVDLKPAGRAAMDQFLVARSMEGALTRMDIGQHARHKSVDLRVTGLGNDKEYLTDIAQAWIKLNGGKIVAADAASDMKLHLIVQAAGSDTEEAKWVLPIGIPTFSGVGGLGLSEVVFFSNKRQIARCHLWAYAEDAEGTVLHAQPPVYQTHYISNRELFGVTIGKSSDLDPLKDYEVLAGKGPTQVPVVEEPKD